MWWQLFAALGPGALQLRCTAGCSRRLKSKGGAGSA